MGKNIVVCCDGTGEEFGACNSNVVKFYAALEMNGAQIGYYHPGVGTMGAPAADSGWDRFWSRIDGLAFGAGLMADIGDAYRFLMDRYAPGDRIYLLGFSRGAYTVRGLAGLIHMFGLLHPGNQGQIPYMLRRMRQDSHDPERRETFQIAHAFKAVFARDCPIHFLGVWDTVSSVGWILNPLVLPFTAANPSVRIARQALAIDERRCYFQARLLNGPLPGQELKQVWFAGVHGDVGGGYPEAQSGLSKLALEWMLAEADGAGLRVNRERAAAILGRRPESDPGWAAPDPNARMHDTLQGWWWLLEVLPHRYFNRRREAVYFRIPLGRRRTIPEGASFHASTALRRGYDPPNRPARCGPEEPWRPYPPEAASAPAV